MKFPCIGTNDVIVPGSSRLSFKIDLTSEGANADANRTIVNNLGRAIVSNITVKLEGQIIYELDDADIFLCYQDLWKTTQERKNALYQGIQTEAVREIRIRAGDAGTAVKEDMAIGTAFSNMFCIPLDFEMLTSQNPFFQYKFKYRLSYELTFNDNGRVIVSTNTATSHKVSEINLEYETVNSPELATMIQNKYNGRSTVMYNRDV